MGLTPYAGTHFCVHVSSWEEEQRDEHLVQLTNAYFQISMQTYFLFLWNFLYDAG